MRSTSFGMELRQMNKPAIGSSWPMALSPDGLFAIAGMEKDKWKPLKCRPGSSKAELRRFVGQIPNVIAVASCGSSAVIGDMSDMYTAKEVESQDKSLLWVVSMDGNMNPKVLKGAGGIPRSVAISGIFNSSRKGKRFYF